jgi:hypothetical protein
MTLWVVPLALLCGLAVGGTAFSLFALWRVHGLMQALRGGAGTIQTRPEAGSAKLRETVEALSARLRDLERNPVPAALPGMPRPGMNLTKRTQALRLHRQGEPPERIAAALELPRQEVDLLLKVHRIVLASV